MKIVTSRDIKNNPNILLDDPSETIITSRGRPKAICFPIEEHELNFLEDLIQTIRHSRAKVALERLRTGTMILRANDKGNPIPEDEVSASRLSDKILREQGRLF
ncbi:MAG: hypothetical protein JW971_03200 [Synergistales bacterium]|nr:hypothetical protein [Synergistales bacterium]